MKVVIAGGGSSYTPGIIKSLVATRDRFPFNEIVLYDIDEYRLERMKVIVDDLFNQHGLHKEITLLSTTDAKSGLEGAGFIFSQLRVGGLEMRSHDEKIPLKYGLVGQETCGLGGFAYGMRSMGGFLDFVGKVQEYAPDAWIMNYTNPETIIAEAVRRKYPNAKIVNACDMTIAIEGTIAEFFNLDQNDWVAEYYGLNHFGWFRQIYDTKQDRDIMPELIEKILNNGLKIASFEGGDPSWQMTYDNLVRQLELFPQYLPNTYLQYYLMPDLTVEQSDPNFTRSDMILKGRELATETMYKDILNNKNRVVEKEPIGVHGSYIVDMAASILNDEGRRFMAIVPNNGLIPNLREDAVVEVAARFTAKGIEPIALSEPIPDFHKGLMEAQVAAEKLLVDSFFQGSYQRALEAFTLNQTVDSAIKAKKVLDEFILVNNKYWPELK